MQIKAEYACLQAYLTQFIWRSNHNKQITSKLVIQKSCETAILRMVLNSYKYIYILMTQGVILAAIA